MWWKDIFNAVKINLSRSPVNSFGARLDSSKFNLISAIIYFFFSFFIRNNGIPSHKVRYRK